MRALISVSDKTGLVDLARELHGLGVELVSSGGSAKAIAEAGIPDGVVNVVTGFGETAGAALAAPAFGYRLAGLRSSRKHCTSASTSLGTCHCRQVIHADNFSSIGTRADK